MLKMGFTNVLVVGESITVMNIVFVIVVSVNVTLYFLGPQTQFDESVVPEITNKRSLYASL